MKAIGKPVFLTYSFPKKMSAEDRKAWPADIPNWRQFSQTDIKEAKAALKQWGKASGVTFLEAKPGNGDIQFSWIPSSSSGFSYQPSQYAFSPDSPEEFSYFAEYSGNVYLNTAYTDYFEREPNFKKYILLHEIGHALGLKHPFDISDYNQRILSSKYNSVKYTVMAYTNGEKPPLTLGPIDKAAIKKLYGSPSADGKQVAKWSWNAKKETLTQFGKVGNDVILGTRTTDIMHGEDGDDRLQGFHGNDKLAGGYGNDVLIGGPGRDTFVFDTQPADDTNVDRIVDYDVDGAQDKIVLSSAIFSEAGPVGQLSEAVFVISSGPKNTASRIIFDYGYSNALYYDPDGTGARPQIKFATLNYTALNASDFLII